MILLTIIIVGLLTGIALLIHCNFSRYDHDGEETAGGALLILFGILSILAVIVFAYTYIGLDARISENQTRYEMLTYQWDNNFYDNDNDVGKQQLVDQIREWNEDLSRYKKLQHDVWIGVFVPDVFDQFEFISLEPPGGD
jgi:hypothetical protein